MGYRNYIGLIPKKEYNKIKSLTHNDLLKLYGEYNEDSDNQGYVSSREFGKQLYEFGKYCDFNPPKGSVKTFFKNKETELQYNSDTELKIVTKEFFAYIVGTYTEKVRSYYKDMLKDFNFESEYYKSRKGTYDSNYDRVTLSDNTLMTDKENISVNKCIDHIVSMAWEWGITPFGDMETYLPYNLDNERTEIVTSWKYEYSIFELVKLYKEFDWKKNYLYYYGH